MKYKLLHLLPNIWHTGEA